MENRNEYERQIYTLREKKPISCNKHGTSYGGQIGPTLITRNPVKSV
jgi:hypothetical protein